MLKDSFFFFAEKLAPDILHVIMLWYQFYHDLNFIFLCFKHIIKHYHTQKQGKWNLNQG